MQKIKNLYDYLPKRQRVYHSAYHRLAHYIYPKESRAEIKVEHVEPKGIKDRIAYYSIRTMRKSYDLLSRYDPNNMT